MDKGEKEQRVSERGRERGARNRSVLTVSTEAAMPFGDETMCLFDEDIAVASSLAPRLASPAPCAVGFE